MAPESPREVHECPICRDVGFLRADVELGHPDFGKPLPCPGEAHAPERMRRLAQLSGLPEGFLDWSLDDIEPNDHNREMLAAAREVMTWDGGFLYLWGGPGNAKTNVLVSLVNHFNKGGRTAAYVKFAKVVDYMRDAFIEKKQRALDPMAQSSMSYIERFQQLVKIPVIAIDEMDKARSTEFADDFRFDFLDDRYLQALAGETITIFASNANPNRLPEPIWDRIRDGRFRVLENRQPSARPAKRR